MELSHSSYESDQRPDDEQKERQDDNQGRGKGRLFSNPVTRKAVSGWFGSTPSEYSPRVTPDPEKRMPVSIVAPENGDRLSRTISHEAAIHSDVWLNGQVRPLEVAAPGEEPFKLEPEEHVEQDAWHSIVVDKHGHEDVNARMQYGQAFRQEQREVQQSALSDTTPLANSGSSSDDDENKDSPKNTQQTSGDPNADSRQEPPAPISVASTPQAPGAQSTQDQLTDAEEAAFQQLLKRAGFDELYNSLDQQSAVTGDPNADSRQEPPAPAVPQPVVEVPLLTPQTETPYVPLRHVEELPSTGGGNGYAIPPKPAQGQGLTAEQNEYALRTQARTRALIAFAAGLIIGNHFGKKKVRHELTKTLQEIEEETQVKNTQYLYAQQMRSESQLQQRAQEQVVATQPQGTAVPFPVQASSASSGEVPVGQAFRQEQREVQQSALSDTTLGIQQPIEPSSGSTSPTLSGPVPPPRMSIPASHEALLPAGLSQPQLPPGVSVRKDSQHLLPAHVKAGASLVLNPWVWLVIGLLILLFFAASFV